MIPQSIRSMFRRTHQCPVQKARADSLQEARLDLLDAQQKAEYWAGMVRVLNARVKRLEGSGEPALSVEEHPQ